MDSHDIEDYFASHKNILAMLLLIVGMVLVSGFFMGMRQNSDANSVPSPWQNPEKPKDTAAGKYPVAPLYKDIPNTKWKANRNWKNVLSNLPSKEIDRKPRKALTQSEKTQVIADRSDRRAFDGAPPTIPHAINYRDVLSCTACHSQDSNTVIAGVRVPVMSHHFLSNCTQCHAPSDGMNIVVRSGTTGLVVENKFTGTARNGKGTRAYKGAPPTVPHPLWMRQNCMSCHGPDMPDAIVTPHAQRSSCLQCHAMDSRLDNREQVSLPLPKGGL